MDNETRAEAVKHVGAPSGRSASVVAFMLIMLAIAALACMHDVLPFQFGYIAIFTGVTMILDALSAVMLFDLFLIEGRPLMLGAACGYLSNALLTLPWGILFPGVFVGPASYSNQQSAIWLTFMLHLFFPIAIFFGAQARPVALERRVRRLWFRFGIGVTLGFVSVCTAMATIGREYLPIVIKDHHVQPVTHWVFGSFVVIVVGVCVKLFSPGLKEAELRRWIGIAILASTLDVLLNFISKQRFTVPWYAGKIEMVVASSVVLLVLIRNWASLYAGSVRLAESLRLTLSERSRWQERFDRQHMIAAELQQASLPLHLPDVAQARLHAVYRPAVHDLEIGGDWYDAFVLDDNRLVLTVGDVAGKGLGAALIMGKVRQMLRMAALIHPDPAVMLNVAHKGLMIEHADTMVTAFAAVLDLDNGKLAWASAGHPPALLRHEDGTIESLHSVSLPLGLRADEPLTAESQLGKAAMLLAYTDGLVEIGRDLGDGIDALKKCLADPQVAAAADPALEVYHRLHGETARDDIAVVALAFTPLENQDFHMQWVCNTTERSTMFRAREAMRECLRDRLVAEEVIVPLELSYSEIVGNIMRYAPGDFTTLLEITADTASVTVTDNGPGFVYERPVLIDAFAESGRGLYLVSKLSSELSVTSRESNGTTVKAGFRLR